MHADAAMMPATLRCETLRAMPLERRFALAGGVVMAIAMVVVGAFVSARIVEAVTRNAAISSAVYMESFVAPLSQELAESDRLSDASIARLDRLLATEPLAERIVSVKIWRRDGRVVYASDKAAIGRRFEPDAALVAAFGGELSAEFDELDDEEAAAERARDVPLVEVYNPIHSIEDGKVIAVAEFYQDATELEDDVVRAQAMSFAVVGGALLLTFTAMFGIVRAASRTIETQHRELAERFDEVASVSAQNVALRRRIQAASGRASAVNERQMRRVSAELHDGPAQALALASLRLDSVARRAGALDGDPEVAELRRSLADAMADIRDISRGLSLPELAGRPLAEVIEQAIANHERRTGTLVARDLEGVPPAREVGHGVLICAYRFVQEGLMNAFRHAGGVGQAVRATASDGAVEIEVADEGPGFAAAPCDEGLGLSGLRERVETLGGEFAVESGAGGTKLVMTLGLG